MKKVSILSGAVKNAGDYLILHSLKKMIEHIDSSIKIKVYNRLESLEDRLDELNSSDCIIMAGGPLIMPGLYPEHMPFVKNIEDVNVPVYMVGAGWYGKNDLSRTIYNDYKLGGTTLKLIKRISEYAPISCRDHDTMTILRNHGIDNVIMTGCPAWYSSGEYDSLNSLNVKQRESQKIFISDPGYKINIERAQHIATYVKKIFPDSYVTYVFHRGVKNDKYTPKSNEEKNEILLSEFKKMNINVADISYSCEGMKIYDDCDFHIGFRLHAHIYNLSCGNRSILIEEDGRGIAFNETVGLMGVRPYTFNYDKMNKRIELLNNEYMLNQIDDLLFFHKETDYLQMLNAANFMRKTSNVMMQYLKTII